MLGYDCFLLQTSALANCRLPLTVCGHSDGDAFLEATILALVSGHLVDGASFLVLTSVGWPEVFLNCPPEEALDVKRRHTCSRVRPSVRRLVCYLTTLAGDAAIVIARRFVPAHHAQLVFVQVTRDVPWERRKESSNHPNGNRKFPPTFPM